MTLERIYQPVVLTVLSSLTLSAALLLALPGCGGAPPQGGGEQGGPPEMPPSAVRLGDIRLEQVVEQREVIGRLQAIRRVTVGSEVDGRVEQVLVEEGDVVLAHADSSESAEIIARLDDTTLQLQKQTQLKMIAQAAAQVEVARANLDQAKSDLKQVEELFERNSAKPKEVEDARTLVKAQQATLEATLASLSGQQRTLDELEDKIARTIVRAPFDGVITQKFAERGQFAMPGTAMVEMVSVGEIEAILDVPEELINNMQIGAEVDLEIDALGTHTTGRVMAIIPEGGNLARTFPVKVRMSDEVEITNQAGDKVTRRLLPGMSVTAVLPASRKMEALTVPRDAVLYTAMGPIIWLYVPQQQAEGQGADQAGQQSSAGAGAGAGAGPGANGAGGPPMGTARREQVRVMFGIGDRYAVEQIYKQELLDGGKVVIEGGEMIPMVGAPLMAVPDGQPMPDPASGGAEGDKAASPSPDENNNAEKENTDKPSPQSTPAA